MDPNEMLKYVQKCSHTYASELDRRFPDVRKVMGRLVRSVPPGGARGQSPDSTPYVPCDLYNQNNSCPYARDSLTCRDARGNMRIHSCTICYFSMGGMINLHRQTMCPLLSLLKNAQPTN